MNLCSLTSLKPPYGNSSFPPAQLESPAHTSSLTRDPSLDPHALAPGLGEWRLPLGTALEAGAYTRWDPQPLLNFFPHGVLLAAPGPHTLRFLREAHRLLTLLQSPYSSSSLAPTFHKNTRPIPHREQSSLRCLPPDPLLASPGQCPVWGKSSGAEKASSAFPPQILFLQESPSSSGLWLLSFSLQIQIPEFFSIRTQHPHNPEGYALLTLFIDEDTEA